MATFRPATRKYDTVHVSPFRLLFVVYLPGGAEGRHAKTRNSHHVAGFRVATFRPARRRFDTFISGEFSPSICRVFAWRGERSPRENTPRLNAALTHTSRPYCDLKTSKIAFFFRKSFGFLSNFQISLADGPVLCSERFIYVLNTTLLRPLRFNCDYIASPRRPHGDHRRPRCDCAMFSASLRRLYGDYCVCPAQ